MTHEEKATAQKQAYIKEYRSNSNIENGKTLCLGFMLVLSGKIRVYVSSEEGREITLFYLKKHDCCALSAACVLQQIVFETQFSVISNAQILVLPPQFFSCLIENNKDVKLYIYELIATRFSSVMAVLEQIVFTRLDKRIAQFLLQQRDKTGSNELFVKQLDIANHVNSARVAVTRVLNHFAGDSILECKRGCIILKDIEYLQRITQ